MMSSSPNNLNSDSGHGDIGLILPRNGSLTFLITITNNYTDNTNNIADEDDITPLDAITSGRQFDSLETIIMAAIAAVMVLFISGHVIMTCRHFGRRQTWIVNGTAAGATSAASTCGTRRGRSFWTSKNRRHVGKSKTSSLAATSASNASGAFHPTDTYRTLAYAYVSSKHEVTSPGSSPASSQTDDDVILPSPWRQWMTSSASGDTARTSSEPKDIEWISSNGRTSISKCDIVKILKIV